MIFSGRVKIDYSIRITFSNKNLMQKSSTKMLGVIIDDRLSWSEHINAVNGKISKINGILFKLSKYLNSNTLKIIYNSLSYPHLQYGNAVWGNAANKYLNRLTVSQKRAIRTISHVGYLHHTNELFKELNIIQTSEQIARL